MVWATVSSQSCFCIENPKDALRKLLALINEFSKVAENKIITQKSDGFLYTND